jgi:hypothetical protein
MRARLDDNGRILIRCPGCSGNEFTVGIHAIDSRWTFNRNFDRPTFTPSLHVKMEFGDGSPTAICHSYVTDGRIQFLPDSTHALAGKTVDLPEFE